MSLEEYFHGHRELYASRGYEQIGELKNCWVMRKVL